MDIKIYTKNTCNFCFAAKHILAKCGLSYEEIPVIDQATVSEMQKLSGASTVPQIFIDGVSIGGYQELAGMVSSGRLNAA